MVKICKGLIILLSMSFGFVNAIEPITTSFVVGTTLSALIGKQVYNYFHETCNHHWIAYNSTGLEVDMKRKLFGQHIASRVIMKAVTGFMNNKNPKKPLVLSLHGWTGTGKNFVSQLIAENIYEKGMTSSYVHQFVSTTHFPHPSQIDTYKTQLQQWIKGNVTICPRSLFIFDEMDKMHAGLIDSIKPYLDYYDNLDGISYRQAIFIFLSNAGGENITRVVLDFWSEGREREELKLKDLEGALSLEVFNNRNSGFWHTSLIDKNLVDFFVPFLPLEYSHVRMCVLAEMEARGLTPDEEFASEVASDMTYFPKEEKVFSKKGCKTIGSKFDYFN
ncbi:hypothetical protein AAFF_G00337200 [Aldrovandia affinis]|uniref:Torsin n=1 Tax=Aldrovandia affinis TaxID=143900 RepID=A0AAD7SL20_9TELE|nr:hypothetical protein AAFF_G00337200 [Aldrovandia affinis]